MRSSYKANLKTNGALFGAMLSLAACGATSTPATSTTAPTPSSSTPSATSAASSSVSLTNVPSGTVKLGWNASTKQVSATFDMYGFTPLSSHAVHIHQGTCTAQGPVLAPFPNVTADSSGAIKTTVTALFPTAGKSTAYLNIHLAPSAQLGKPGSLGFTPVSCADLAGKTPGGTLTMQAPPQSGLHPTGSAKLDYSASAKTLTVSVQASGLAPGSSHAVHIHLGSCQAQGAVKYPLTVLTAGTNGSASTTTVIHSVTSAPPAQGWYLNVHNGSPAQILSSSGKPTLYFAPILCGNIH